MNDSPVPPAARRLSRRALLGLAAAAGAGALMWRFWPEQGWLNPCLSDLPPSLAGHQLVRAAWEGLDPAQVWDGHAHLIGLGDSGSGVAVNPDMLSIANPLQFAQRLFYMNAGCAHEAPGRVDQSYIERMHNLIDGMRPGFKLLLLAFDHFHTTDGRLDAEHSAFYTPNDYARNVAARWPAYFEWAASIHPYRADCVEALEQAARDRARAVKWLPAAQGMDPASPRCDRFYEALARLHLPLIVHAGEERAVEGAGRQELGNPLRLRRALEHGVRVVVAHCASIGSDRDLDRGADGPVVDSFALFSRLMDEPHHEKLLFADISAVTQLNRAGPALKTIIARDDWHARLLNGSDYPLPGVMPLFSVDHMVGLGLIEPAAAPVLSAIRRHNPLLFDFVLKRHLRVAGKGFANSVFETRRFFDPAGA
jgi:mannonate dehydratase